ncbi:MAG: glycosyl hydrolase 53 family protein [Candidatus Aenigmarchaeota archaeon]|nr:glycosyl hydrolase 53 family protein [Candidatus Aenigmarchaeota archaeon]
MKNNFYLGIYYDPIKPAQEWIINERVRNIDKQFILDDLQHIKDLGLKYVRLPLRWILIEQRKDKLDFSFYDWLLKRMESFDLTPCLIVGDDIPKWAWKKLNKNFSEFLIKSFNHFCFDSSLYQISNELDVGNKIPWKWSKEAKSDFLLEAAKIIRDKDKNSLIVINGFWDIYHNCSEYFKHLHDKNLDFDFIGIDHYAETNPFKKIENLNKLMSLVHRKFKKNLILTELGYSTWFPIKYTEHGQKKYIKKAFSVINKTSYLKGIFYFCLKDYDFFYHLIPTEEHFGLIKKNNRKKIGYYTFKNEMVNFRKKFV